LQRKGRKSVNLAQKHEKQQFGAKEGKTTDRRKIRKNDYDPLRFLGEVVIRVFSPNYMYKYVKGREY
jgi:hypothetical protein